MFFYSSPHEKTSDVVTAKSDFQGLEFLVGGVWTGRDKNGLSVSEGVDLLLNRTLLAAVQMTVSADGTSATQTCGFIAADAATGRLLYISFQSTGAVLLLKQIEPTGGSPWRFEGELFSGGGRIELRSSLIQEGPDEVRSVLEQEVDDEWQITAEMLLERH